VRSTRATELTLTEIDSTGTLSVHCDEPMSYTLGLSTGGSRTDTPRRMSSGTNILEAPHRQAMGFSCSHGQQ